MKAPPLPLLVLIFALGACGKNMVQQPRYDDYETSPLLAGGTAMQAPPAGTIDRAALQRAAADQRPPMSLALVQRGQERYAIYCAPCHADDGSGNGVIPSRGFPHPPNYREARLKAAPPEYFYQVITDGHGVMYSYADRVDPPDRWAIAAYIRALQSTSEAPHG